MAESTMDPFAEGLKEERRRGVMVEALVREGASETRASRRDRTEGHASTRQKTVEQPTSSRA
jgi:hypothetical protein